MEKTLTKLQAKNCLYAAMKPARTGGDIRINAELIEKSEHLIKAKCYLTNTKGERIATASGNFLPFSERDFKDFEKVF
jgi:hypothetical protein